MDNIAVKAHDFVSLKVYPEPKQRKFLSHAFDLYAGLSFPDADVEHLETCIAFFLWAFSVRHLNKRSYPTPN